MPEVLKIYPPPLPPKKRCFFNLFTLYNTRRHKKELTWIAVQYQKFLKWI